MFADRECILIETGAPFVRLRRVHAASVLILVAAIAPAADDIVISDFEGPDYGGWKSIGDAFGPGPAKGTRRGQQPVTGFDGQRLVNSFADATGDRATGTLTSPEFTIERPFISFLVGGGKDAEKTAMHLLVDGAVVRRATGPNDRPGGSEALDLDAWDVAEFVGRKAVIRIVDEATGGWGHVTIDRIVQSDRRPAAPQHDAGRDFEISKRYLAIPIKNGAPKRLVTAVIDGHPVVRNTIELADGEPDWWAVMDVGAWRGKTVRLVVDRLRADSRALVQIEPTDTIPEGENLYREPLRGQFHFSPRRGWNNDPNGCVFYKGEYHLFFQHNPYGWAWGNMHWGHAVSKDLVHWEELGDALLPDDLGPMYSGSAVVDHANTSGFGTADNPPLVLFYTAAGNPTVQCLAWSTDGRTFTKYEGNPIIGQITRGNRDPKVFWHGPTKRWVMVLYVEQPGKTRTMQFFTSANLRDWTPTSVVTGTPGTNYLHECPDCFELPVDGDPARSKWVLLGANTEYAVGSFDGTTFTADAVALPGHRGKGFYAPQSFNDVPDGRRLFIGWWQTETKGMPFNQSMSLPLELGLTETADGPRLTFAPARETEALRARSHRLGGSTLAPGSADPLAGVTAELVELRADIEPAAADEIVLTVRGGTIAYDVKAQELVVNGHRAPAPLRDGRLRVAVFCDRTGLEVFAADGLCYVPFPFQPQPDDRGLGLEARGGAARINSLDVHELRSAWPDR